MLPVHRQERCLSLKAPITQKITITSRFRPISRISSPRSICNFFIYEISSYKPITIEIDAPLKPFIPEYIPAIGEVDAFMKMSRPDGTPETLGLVQLVNEIR